MTVEEALENTAGPNCYFRDVCNPMICGHPDYSLCARLDDEDLKKDADVFLKEMYTKLLEWEKREDRRIQKERAIAQRKKEINDKRRATRHSNYLENNLIKKHRKRIAAIEAQINFDNSMREAFNFANNIVGYENSTPNKTITDREKLLRAEIEKSKQEIKRLQQIKKNR